MTSRAFLLGAQVQPASYRRANAQIQAESPQVSSLLTLLFRRMAAMRPLVLFHGNSGILAQDPELIECVRAFSYFSPDKVTDSLTASLYAITSAEYLFRSFCHSSHATPKCTAVRSQFAHRLVGAK